MPHNLGVLLDRPSNFCSDRINPTELWSLYRWHNNQLPADGPRVQPERLSMKNMILAAVAALSLTTAIVSTANAKSTIADNAGATRQQQTGSYSQ